MKMKYLYHITHRKHLDSILAKGLKCKSGMIGFVKREDQSDYKRRYGCHPVFLTSDVDYIMRTQLGKDYIMRNSLCVLRVDVDGLNIEPEYEYFYNLGNKWVGKECEGYAKTYICRGDIGVERIELHIEDLGLKNAL